MRRNENREILKSLSPMRGTRTTWGLDSSLNNKINPPTRLFRGHGRDTAGLEKKGTKKIIQNGNENKQTVFECKIRTAKYVNQLDVLREDQRTRSLVRYGGK